MAVGTQIAEAPAMSRNLYQRINAGVQRFTVVENSDISEIFSSIVTPAASSHRSSLEKAELK